MRIASLFDSDFIDGTSMHVRAASKLSDEFDFLSIAELTANRTTVGNANLKK